MMPEWSKGNDLRSFVQCTRGFKPRSWHAVHTITFALFGAVSNPAHGNFKFFYFFWVWLQTPLMACGSYHYFCSFPCRQNCKKDPPFKFCGFTPPFCFCWASSLFLGLLSLSVAGGLRATRVLLYLGDGVIKRLIVREDPASSPPAGSASGPFCLWSLWSKSITCSSQRFANLAIEAEKLKRTQKAVKKGRNK